MSQPEKCAPHCLHATDDGAVPRPLHVAVFPHGSINPYLRLHADNLKPFGIRSTGIPKVTEKLLLGDLHFDALHLHWNLEHCWRTAASGEYQPWQTGLRKVVRLWKILRRLKHAGLKVLWTAHELEPPEGGDWIDWLGYLVCAHSADLCICHSEYCRSLLRRKFWIPANKALTIPLGTYEDVLVPSERRNQTLVRWNVPIDRRILLCFGGLRPRKGVDVALDAIDRLDSSYHLILQGAPAGPAQARWHADVVARAHQTSRVTVIAEPLADEDLANLLHAADCVLMPYSQIISSAGLAAALTVGKGVVASDLPYFREVLSPVPDAAVFFAVNDSDALSAAIRRFFAVPVVLREDAARRLREQLRWQDAVAPLGAWLRREAGGRHMDPGS